MRVVMGIDASLTGTGLVAVPANWGLDWGKVARLKLGLQLSKDASVAERVRRLDYICSRMMKFAEEHEVTDVFMEQYAFSAKTSQSHSLGELGGNLKRDVVMGLVVPITVVTPNTARTLIGSFPTSAKKGQPKLAPVKSRVHAVLKNAGLPSSWDGDEIDAWVVANWGMSGIEGADALILREAA